MVIKWLTKMVRRWLIGEDALYVFEPSHSIELPTVKHADLYLHIPFCRSLCPYCPYNRIHYDKDLAKPYLDAIISEIDAYHTRLGDVEIGSVYIGGGTPTTLIDELGVMLEHIRKRFRITGDIAVETIPSDINDEVIEKLRHYGVNLLSLGVQSFDDKYLKLIGRNYRSDILHPVIKKLNSSGFDSVNIDMMFALPGQTTEEVIEDLKQVIELNSDQVTLYPLFTFPYTTVGKHLDLKRVRFPKLFNRRKMYRSIHNFCLKHGFNRVSVWGFKHSDVPRFSSVTREYYIGIGAGAASCLPGIFYLNTFSVDEYIKHAKRNKLPVSLKMQMNQAMERYNWLYWRLYDTYIPKKKFNELFSNDKRLNILLGLAKRLGLYIEEDDYLILTERGSFWIHLIQNYYVLYYIDKVWTKAMGEPWPDRIPL